MTNKIINKLSKFLNYSKSCKSSHWESRLQNADLNSITTNFGFGSFETKSLKKSIRKYNC